MSEFSKTYKQIYLPVCNIYTYRSVLVILILCFKSVILASSRYSSILLNLLDHRLTVSPACKLNLRSYPMDTQNCHIKIVSCEWSFLIL